MQAWQETQDTGPDLTLMPEICEPSEGGKGAWRGVPAPTLAEFAILRPNVRGGGRLLGRYGGN
jgi:hypothetical protein